MVRAPAKDRLLRCLFAGGRSHASACGFNGKRSCKLVFLRWHGCRASAEFANVIPVRRPEPRRGRLYWLYATDLTVVPVPAAPSDNRVHFRRPQEILMLP